MSAGTELIAKLASRLNLADYQKTHWPGTFAEYLDIVRDDPRSRAPPISASTT